MGDSFNTLIYVVLCLAAAVCLFLAALAANRQLRRPVLILGGLSLSGLVPILLPVYLGIVFFKARQARRYIFLMLLLTSLGFLMLSVSGFAKNVSFSDVYLGDVNFKEGDALVIHGEFIKAHENQYVVTRPFNIGGHDSVAYHGYYEILPLKSGAAQKVRVFVSDVSVFDNDLPTKNLVNRVQFNAYVPLVKNLDEAVIDEIKGSLKPNQTLLIIAEHSESRFRSNQNQARIGTGVFGILSLIFVLLVYREFKANRREGV